MNVKLISYSQGANGGSLLDQVAYAARVSNPANQNNTGTSEKLVRYLIENKHWSPLEMVSVCLEIETTRDIARQILRHRSFSFQEFSQRYADPTKDLDFVIREARLQDTKNRQNSLETNDPELQAWWEAKQRTLLELVNATYAEAIGRGMAKEQARAALPEGLIGSRMYVNGTLRSWIHFIQVRSDVSTQKEHRQIAVECAKIIAEIFPLMNEIYSNPTV